MQENKQNQLDNLRQSMGTLPSMQPQKETIFIRGCSSIQVDLIGKPANPYRQIFSAATATWGNDDYEDKWPKTSVANRIKVVIAALTGQTLPQALEPLSFQFRVVGASRSAFDQTARARIGATFFSSGVRDNNKLDASFIVPTEFFDNDEIREKIVDYVEQGKDLYEYLINQGQGSWQAARSILWMGMAHPFEMSFTYLSLVGQCSRRLKFCEQEDTVGTFWSVREAIKNEFPLLAEVLRPGCDRSKKCDYHKAYTLSEMFGCLFSSCGRHPSNSEYDYATFNHSCSNRETMSEQLGFEIPVGRHPMLDEDYIVSPKDMAYFMED